MDRARIAVAIAATLLVAHATSLAGPVPATLTADDFNSLTGAPLVPVGAALLTPMSEGLLQTEVTSQAFTDGGGIYAYLYQVRNLGGAGNNAVEAFTLSSFIGATAATSMGYLTANVPGAFSLGVQSPLGASVDAIAGPTISFAFPAYVAGAAIDPGEESTTLFVLSDAAPGLIRGNVINGEVSFGDVVGPIPEPATLSLLALAALAGLRGSKGRRG